MPIALTRSVPPSIVNCELTHLTREPISFSRAVEQHALYEKALIAVGCTIERLPPMPDMPDSVFVEDAAIVLPEVAIITRPGAESRRLETASVADRLRLHLPLEFIASPGTLDGGDVLVIGRTIYVGDSSRTNPEGVRQLTEIASAYGYAVHSLRLSGCLHLKSAVTLVGEDVVLLNPQFADTSAFQHLRRIGVDPSEPLAANALRIGENVIYAANFPETLRRLEKEGIQMHVVESDELQKAEGAITCGSIVIPDA